MSDIEWGEPIAVDGKRPDWLRDGGRVLKQHDYPTSSDLHGQWRELEVGCVSWPTASMIRLPSDHPYYKAIERGFTYWPGGEDAPDDWDGGDVLRRGHTEPWVALYLSNQRWSHWYKGPVDLSANDIIGYRRRVEPDALGVPADVVDRMVRFVRQTAKRDKVVDYTELDAIVSLLPGDPLVLRAREICAAQWPNIADGFMSGKCDGYPSMQAVLRALREQR